MLQEAYVVPLNGTFFLFFLSSSFLLHSLFLTAQLLIYGKGRGSSGGNPVVDNQHVESALVATARTKAEQKLESRLKSKNKRTKHNMSERSEGVLSC